MKHFENIDNNIAYLLKNGRKTDEKTENCIK